MLGRRLQTQYHVHVSLRAKSTCEYACEQPRATIFLSTHVVGRQLVSKSRAHKDHHCEYKLHAQGQSSSHRTARKNGRGNRPAKLTSCSSTEPYRNGFRICNKDAVCAEGVLFCTEPQGCLTSRDVEQRVSNAKELLQGHGCSCFGNLGPEACMNLFLENLGGPKPF